MYVVIPPFRLRPLTFYNTTNPVFYLQLFSVLHGVSTNLAFYSVSMSVYVLLVPSQSLQLVRSPYSTLLRYLGEPYQMSLGIAGDF